jgi:lipopolysaccharide biosynthesis regulator YciM
MRRLVSLILSIFAFSSTGAIAQDMVRPLAATAIAPAPTKISDKSLLPGLAQADALNHATPVQMLQAGDLYLHYGFFSRAIKQWREILVTQGRSHDPKVVPIVDAAIGQLASLYTRLGMFDALEKLLSEIGTRPITGSATEAVQAAREAHAQVKTNSRRLFLCGPPRFAGCHR